MLFKTVKSKHFRLYFCHAQLFSKPTQLDSKVLLLLVLKNLNTDPIASIDIWSCFSFFTPLFVVLVLLCYLVFIFESLNENCEIKCKSWTDQVQWDIAPVKICRY